MTDATTDPERIRFGFVLGLTLPDLFERHAEWAQEAEHVGASLLSMGEVSVLTADPYLMLQSFAWHAKTATVGTVVSMPGLRHPVVHARTMVTLQELTGGRSFLGLGRGLGGLKLIGERPGTMAQLGEYAELVRALCAGEKVVYEGKEQQLAYAPHAVPIFLAGWGDKGFDIAGRFGDGMIVGNGATPDRIEHARKLARAGAEAAGRSFEDLETWYTIRIHVAESEAQGINEMEFYLTRLMLPEFDSGQSLRGLDPDLVRRVKLYLEQANRKVDSYGFECGENRALLDRYDLTTWGARQLFLTGTVDDIVARLQELFDAGARNFIVPQMLPDIMKTTREVGEVFARLAETRRNVMAV